MYNPLCELSVPALDTLIKKGYFYYVRQSYPRGRQGVIKEAFLITPYRDQGKANEHYIKIKDDPRKWIYSVNVNGSDPISAAEAKNKLYAAASQPAGFRVYLDRLKFAEWTPPKWLAYKMTGYIKSQFGWPIDRAEINVGLTFEFGQLFVKFHRRGIFKKAPLEEIEKIKL